MTGIATLGQSGPGSNDNEGYSTHTRFPELESHHQTQETHINSV